MILPFTARWHELRVFRWWLIFERARRYEIRRWPRFPVLLNFMCMQELALHESQIHSRDLVDRVMRIKDRRK
jgi:hypothetical protein